jgi:hypothetical protein
LPFLSPTAADGFSSNFCVAPHEGAGRGLKLALVGGWTRIISQTYFQQHPEQRLTSKTMKGGLNPINRAQMERVFAEQRFVAKRRHRSTRVAVHGTVGVPAGAAKDNAAGRVLLRSRRCFCYNKLVPRTLKLLFNLIVQLCCSQRDLMLENLELRQQLGVLKRRHP